MYTVFCIKFMRLSIKLTRYVYVHISSCKIVSVANCKILKEDCVVDTNLVYKQNQIYSLKSKEFN